MTGNLLMVRFSFVVWVLFSVFFGSISDIFPETLSGRSSYPGQFALSELPEEAWNRKLDR